MSLLNVSPSDRRVLRRGAIAMAVIVLAGKGVPALRHLETYVIASAGEATRELETLRAASRGSRLIQDSLVARSRRVDSVRTSLLHASSPQLAAAELASIVSNYAKQCGARLNATVMRPDSAFIDGIATISVRLSLTTDVEGLAAMLELIEGDPQLFAVREIGVSNPDPGGGEARAETLSVDLLIEARALAEVKHSAR